MIKRLLSRVFGRKPAHVEVHVHGKEERHFEIVPEAAAPVAEVKPARKRTAAKSKSYPAKPKVASRKKSAAKKTPARKKSR